MKTPKIILGSLVALSVATPALAHHEASFTTAEHGLSALTIGAMVIGLATFTILAVKAIRNRA